MDWNWNAIIEKTGFDEPFVVDWLEPKFSAIAVTSKEHNKKSLEADGFKVFLTPKQTGNVWVLIRE